MYQGQNNSIVLEFSESIAQYTEYKIAMFSTSTGRAAVKEWDQTNTTKTGSTITCPLTQAETLKIKPGAVKIEVKLLNNAGKVIFCDVITDNIIERLDKRTFEGV